MSLTPSADGLLTFILSVFKVGVKEVRGGDGRSGKGLVLQLLATSTFP